MKTENTFLTHFMPLVSLYARITAYFQHLMNKYFQKKLNFFSRVSVFLIYVDSMFLLVLQLLAEEEEIIINKKLF